MPIRRNHNQLPGSRLNQVLAGARLDRIYQPDRYDIFPDLSSSKRESTLNSFGKSASPRVHLTKENRDNPANPLHVLHAFA